MRHRTAAFLLLAVASPALAKEPVGCWALRADGATLMRFDVAEKRGRLTATWQRPDHMRWDGASFSNVRGPAVIRHASSIRETPEGLEFSFPDPEPGSTPDVFAIRITDTGAELHFAQLGDNPSQLTREPCSRAIGPWDATRSYNHLLVYPDDPEMAAIFAADQADRTKGVIDWSVVSASDAQRRARTQALLDSGKLRSADDFYHAAFVFQHGNQPADYLKAHALAVISAARGKRKATWIAAATLDRYLQSIGQPQIYGTQFSTAQGATTQEPYRRDLLSDAIRAASNVPSISAQETQRQQIETKRNSAPRAD